MSIQVNKGIIQSIDNRLVNWAEYMARGEAQAVGSNIIDKLMKNQGVLAQGTGSGSGMPDTIYDTDKAVRTLDETHPTLAKVVREHYQNMTSTPEQKWSACGCSSSTYYRKLKDAHKALFFVLGQPVRNKATEQIRVRPMAKAS